jgi:hypothetical protein
VIRGDDGGLGICVLGTVILMAVVCLCLLVLKTTWRVGRGCGGERGICIVVVTSLWGVVARVVMFSMSNEI